MWGYSIETLVWTGDLQSSVTVGQKKETKSELRGDSNLIATNKLANKHKIVFELFLSMIMMSVFY